MEKAAKDTKFCQLWAFQSDAGKATVTRGGGRLSQMICSPSLTVGSPSHCLGKTQVRPLRPSPCAKRTLLPGGGPGFEGFGLTAVGTHGFPSSLFFWRG